MEGKLGNFFYDMTIAVFSKPGRSCINTKPQTTKTKVRVKQQAASNDALNINEHTVVSYTMWGLIPP